ncbi:MAG: SET domain-containing protein-lysine N-methyltransferase [Cytophagaceae bacterium]
MKAIIPGYYIAPSSIPGAGIGLFTSEFIPKDKAMFIAFARHSYSDQIGTDLFEIHFTQLYPNGYINHNSKANTTYDYVKGIYLSRRAIRDIYPGEEIFSDYARSMSFIKEVVKLQPSDWLNFQK